MQWSRRRCDAAHSSELTRAVFVCAHFTSETVSRISQPSQRMLALIYLVSTLYSQHIFIIRIVAGRMLSYTVYNAAPCTIIYIKHHTPCSAPISLNCRWSDIKYWKWIQKRKKYKRKQKKLRQIPGAKINCQIHLIVFRFLLPPPAETSECVRATVWQWLDIIRKCAE